MNKHTPGPWIIEKSPFEVLNVDHGMLTHEICSGYIMIAAIYVDHDSPDAHLLAAAPELLEALELLMKYSARPSCESLHHDKKYRHTALEPCPAEANLYQARIMAEDAIAKAKGKTK